MKRQLAQWQGVKTKLKKLARRHGIDLVILFGSRARGDAGQGSDLDVGVLFAPQCVPSSRQLSALEAHLLDYAQDDLHLVILNFVNPELRRAAEREGQVVYERAPGLFAGFVVENLHRLHQYRYLRQYDRDFLNRFLENTSDDKNLHSNRRPASPRQHRRSTGSTQRS